MSRSSLVLDYFVWHYTLGFRSLTATWLNFMWFIFHFFSIALLVRTLFSPWKRMRASTRSFDLNELLETIIFNILSRLFGALIRLSIIGIGIALLGVGLMVYGVLLIVWLAFPVILLTSCAYGLMLLFHEPI